MSAPLFARTNVRRVTRSWSWVAFAGIPLVLVMGLWQLSSAAGADSPPSIYVETITAAGAPVSVLGGTDGWVLWGQPADVDLTAVTCTFATAAKTGDLPVEPESAITVDDVLGHGTFVRLTSSAPVMSAQSVTCAGGGLTGVARAPAPTPGKDLAFGIVLLVMAPVLLGLGLIARRVTRPHAG